MCVPCLKFVVKDWISPGLVDVLFMFSMVLEAAMVLKFCGGVLYKYLACSVASGRRESPPFWRSGGEALLREKVHVSLWA